MIDAPAPTDPDAPTPAATDAPASADAPAPPRTRRPRRRTVWGRPRRHWLHRTLAGLVSGLVVLVLVATGLVVWSVRRAFPQLGGELTLPGLSAPVTVYRDQYGIPQIYASTAHDLFRAQGYVHAQDRFWEMDFRRHVTAGRLAEMFGESQVATDAFIRTLGWRRIAEQEWSLLSGEAREYLEAYAEGVNAWIEQTGGAAPSGEKSLEYTLLRLLNPGYTVEPWHPVDTLAWLKAMAWDLRGNMTDEINRAVLLGSGLSREQIADLYPEYPFDRNQPIVTALPEPPKHPAPAGEDPSGDEPAADTDAVATAAPALARLAEVAEALPALLGTGGAGIGSNSWAVAGEHTTTGKPLLANDPHLGSSMPGIWYQIGLHCTCGFAVTGFSFSGVPGVIIGHNDRIAWGFTNLGPDVTDLYLEKIDGDRYFDGTEWVPLTVREEVITVAGGEPVTITVRETKHGPLLSDRSADLLAIAARPPVDPDGAPLSTVEPVPTPSLDAAAPGVPEPAAESPYGVALRWTALDPNPTAEAIFLMNRARDWESFREAARYFAVPAQNLLYADVDGNIGYQAPGLIPIRGAGDGTYPVPGWDPAYDWTGFIPFDELPSVLNPEEGWIVTANQAVVGPEYPYLLTHDWSYGFRSQRIVEMLADRLAAGPIDAEVIRQMQFDNYNGIAPTFVAALRRLPDRPAAADLLFDWDFQQDIDSAAGALFNVFYRHLLLRTFDELPEGRGLDGDDRWWVVFDRLLDEPTSPWWDEVGTPEVEDRDTILGRALADAVAELTASQGDDPAQWRWGALHTLTLTHATLGSSGIAPIEWLFNRGPGETAGGSAIVNATGWEPLEGYEVTWLPSMRMIVDLSNLDNSRWIQLTGNSGHAFHPNYADQFELWRTGQDLPMHWERASIEAAATHTLVLRP
jgi:penicillin amidase